MILACRQCWQPMELKAITVDYDAWFCNNLNCPLIYTPQKYEKKMEPVKETIFKGLSRRVKPDGDTERRE